MNLNKIPGQGETGFSRSMLIWGSAFLIFTLLAGLFLWQGNRLDSVSRKSTELASDLRLLSQQMTTQALSASQGFDQSFLLLRQHTQRFDQTLGQLEKGDVGLGVPEFPAELRPELEQVNGQWEGYSKDIDAILSSREAVSTAAQAVVDAQERLPALMSDSGLVADIIRKNRPGNGSQIYQATNQMVIAERIRNSFAALQSGRDVAVDVADSLQRDTQKFSLVVDGMLRGNTKAGVSQVTVPQAREALQRIVSDFGTVVDNAGLLVEVAPTLFEVKEIAGSLEGKGRELFDGASRIESAIMDRSRTNELWTGLGFILGLLSLLSFLMLVAGIYKTTRQQLDSTTRLNEENEQSIMTLLDEMQTLADGDLTVKATVTQHITGAIADSVNYAVDALRSLVGTINDAAANVAGTARVTRETALKLSDASEKQARKIVSASDSVSDLTHSISKVSKSAEASARVADQSLQIAKKGVVSVQKTIVGMDVIRETIQDTSKRIKRLGESSQEIGDIVSLITDIADQTNILALNAAIQASSAGEGGRGFAVVADEVQRLAERAAGASKQIETLVKTIQADTSEAIHSMEKSTSNVVSGARQAEQSGMALADIEKVSRQLAKLIRSISEEAGEQAIVSSVVGEAMASIQSITRQTVESTRETASSIGDLAEQAVDLRRSVEGFRLPGQVQPERPDVPVLGEDEVDDFEEFLISK